MQEQNSISRRQQEDSHIINDLPSAAPGSATRLIPMLGWAVAACLLLALGASWFFFNQKTQRLNEQLAALETPIADRKKQAQQQARMQDVIALLRDRSTQTIVLSDGPEPKVTATVWNNPVREEIAIDLNSLPAPNPDKYFQFWAIVDGAPVSMGMIALRGEDSWETLPFVANAQAFAISEEDKPEGNTTPTVVVLVGKL